MSEKLLLSAEDLKALADLLAARPESRLLVSGGELYLAAQDHKTDDVAWAQAAWDGDGAWRVYP